MKNFRQNNQDGFTIVELMIATSIFAVILLLASMSLLQVGRSYYKGISSSQTQDVVRSVTDDISQAIQFSGTNAISAPQPVTATSTIYYFCAGNKRYTFDLFIQPSSTTHALIRDQNSLVGGCVNPGGWPVGGTELLSSNTRLVQFTVCPPGNQIAQGCTTAPYYAGTNLYRIKIRAIYGADDLLCVPAAGGCASSPPTIDVPDLKCKLITGSQFCGVSELDTVVQERV